MLAEEDLLPPDCRICARVRVDLMAHEVLRAPTPLTSAVRRSRLQDDRRGMRGGEERARPQPLLRFVERLDGHEGIVVGLPDDPIPSEETGVHRIMEDAVNLDWRPRGAEFRPPAVRIQFDGGLLERP